MSMQQTPHNNLYGGCMRERGCGVVTGQLSRGYLSCKNAEKNESLLLLLVQFNVASH